MEPLAAAMACALRFLPDGTSAAAALVFVLIVCVAYVYKHKIRDGVASVVATKTIKEE